MQIPNMQKCNLCPRGCGVDRAVQKGVCGCGDTMRVACICGRNRA